MILRRMGRPGALAALFLVSFAVFLTTWWLAFMPMMVAEGDWDLGPSDFLRYLEWLATPSEWRDGAAWLVFFGAVQAAAFVAMVAPLVGPPRVGGSGRSLRASVIGASVIGGGLGLGGVLTVVTAIGLLAEDSNRWGWLLGSSDSVEMPASAVYLAIWSVAGAVWFFMLRAAGRSRDPNGIAMLLRRLLAGTAIELALAIPVHLLARRRSSCYCEFPTFLAIIGGTAALVWMCGPLAVLWLTRGYRRAWRRGACPECGYPRHTASGVCSECGHAFASDAGVAGG